MTVIIDDITYDAPVVEMERKAEFLDKYARRTADGVLHRELIGVYFNYYLKFGSITDLAVYAALWAKLTEVEEYHTVKVPDETGDYTFTAYISKVSDKLRKQKGGDNYFNGLVVHFIARSPVS
jgi:hypothetical protein